MMLRIEQRSDGQRAIRRLSSRTQLEHPGMDPPGTSQGRIGTGGGGPWVPIGISRHAPSGPEAQDRRALAARMVKNGLDPHHRTPSVLRDELVDRLRRGEYGAIEALVARYGAWIYRVTRRILNDPRDAEEITQDVLLIVVRKIHTFKGEAAFSSWLYRIAVNAAYQRLRARGARREVSLEPFPPVFDDEGRMKGPVADWSAQLEDPAVAAEVRKTIEGGIARLPEDYRIVFVLRDVEGISNEELAGLLGLSVPAVKSRLHRARLVLRHELAEIFVPADRPTRPNQVRPATADGEPSGDVVGA